MICPKQMEGGQTALLTPLSLLLKQKINKNNNPKTPNLENCKDPDFKGNQTTIKEKENM